MTDIVGILDNYITVSSVSALWPLALILNNIYLFLFTFSSFILLILWFQKWNEKSMAVSSTCGSLRGRPRSLLFDLGGRPPRLLSLLQEVNLLGSFLASRGWPPSLLFDLGGQPLRLLSLLQEVNLWSSFLTWRDWPPSFLFDLQGWPLKLLFPTQELSMGSCHLTPHDSHLPCPTWAAMPQSIARSNSMLG